MNGLSVNQLFVAVPHSLQQVLHLIQKIVRNIMHVIHTLVRMVYQQVCTIETILNREELFSSQYE